MRLRKSKMKGALREKVTSVFSAAPERVVSGYSSDQNTMVCWFSWNTFGFIIYFFLFHCYCNYYFVIFVFVKNCKE